MSRLILQCSLDRLGPHYADVPPDPAAPVPPPAAVPYVDFSLSINCGFDVSPEGDDILRLKPWFWKPWTKVCICGIPTAGGLPKDLGTVEVLGNVAGEWNSVPTPQGINAPSVRFLADLESAFQERSSLPANFVFSADTVTRENRPWHAVVGAAASWPGGLNRWLNLTLGFRLPETSLAGYSAIMAAPLGPQSYPIKVAATDKTPEHTAYAFPVDLTKPTLLPTPSADGTGAWDWSYDALPAGSETTARMNACLVALDQGPDVTVDLSTLEPKHTIAATSQAGDWTEDLLGKVAEFFDLPNLLLHALRENVAAAKPWAIDSGFHQLFLASLSDVLNSGRWPEPSRGLLVADIAAELNLRLKNDTAVDQVMVAATLKATEAAVGSDFSKWSALLQQELGYLFNPASPLVPNDPASISSSDEMDTRGREYLDGLTHLYTRVVQLEAVQTIQTSRWTAATQTNSQRFALQAQLPDVLKNISLRRRMLLGLMAKRWPVPAFKDRDTFCTAVINAVNQYVLNRASKTASANPDMWPLVTAEPAAIDDIRDSIVTQITARVEALTQKSTAVAPATAAPPASTLQAEGILIPVADLQSVAGASGTDIHSTIAGSGVLLRRVGGDGIWRALNYALIVDSDGNDLLPQAVPVPLRLHYRDNVSAGTVFYQNLPLAGGSPLPGEGGTFESATDETAGFASPFQLRKAYSAAFPVPGLQYGASYQAWVYYMTHGGYFPAELATHGVAGRPWTFQSPAKTDTSATSVEVPFERTRGFGSVRLSTEGRLAKFKAPSIPDGVRPFSQSLLTRETAKTAKSADQPSIVLLTPEGAPWNDKCATHSFTFAVYPPSVDLDIWQRCIGFELKTKELRSAVRAVVTQTAARLDKDEQDSVAPDDPFVSKIRVVATCLRGSEKGLPARTATFTLSDYTKYADTFNAAPNKDKPLKFVQADPYTVTLSVGPIQFGEPDAQKNCSIQFPVGDVWEIIFRPIADRIPNSVFAAALRPFVYAPDKANEPNAVTLGEMRLRVEVASTWTDADKARTALFNALSLEMQDRNTLEASFAMGTETTALLESLQSATLIVQRWRWNGRPVYRIGNDGVLSTKCGYPFPPDPKMLAAADGVLFGDRPSADHYEVTRSVDLLSGDGDMLLESRNLASQPGALYFRYAVTGESRYSGLMTGGSDTLSTLSSGKDLDLWNRYVIPCRFQQSIPPPTLRMVLPLTVAPDGLTLNSAPHPPLLAVFSDRWFRDDLGGLAEELASELIEVALPEGGDIPQFGPDPIISNIDSPYDGMDIALPPPVGPIGHTFDTGTDAPLFVNTSFVQPGPVLNSGTIMPDLSWHFLKIRFRRRLNQAALESSAVGPMVSPWTQPVWVQILPPANFWNLGVGGALVAVGSMVLDTSSKTVVAGSERIAAAASASPIFVTYVLLTQCGTDAFGHRNQESFLACVKLADLTEAPPEVWAVPAANLRARLLEIQMRPDAPPASDIWDTLFPKVSSDDPIRKDVIARIVRMSGTIASR